VKAQSVIFGVILIFVTMSFRAPHHGISENVNADCKKFSNYCAAAEQRDGQCAFQIGGMCTEKQRDGQCAF